MSNSTEQPSDIQITSTWTRYPSLEPFVTGFLWWKRYYCCECWWNSKKSNDVVQHIKRRHRRDQL